MGRFDFDPFAAFDPADEAEARRILDLAVEEGLAENSEAVDSTSSEGHDWGSLLAGYALGKGATLRVAAIVGLRGWDHLFFRSR